MVVGNGKTLAISHIGSALIYIPNHKPLLLNNILYVPKITKNLINISKLLYDNKLMLDFYDNVCTVKDKVLGKKLLQRKTERGYYWLPVLSRQAILSY